ncbi:universal stress protein [Allorhizobium sp. BGMRC 0089]|uniref:universal stress protein n=1 Tax=Allorhizobium sonneratiae TaxID=2934936 RepID=UPI0020335C79|nr:universal stress protein [Allorhizobium sonneratiae]MCM2291864.1 universal stress protein [Allorhizobium sonneratiae]
MYGKIIVPVDCDKIERGGSILKRAAALLNDGGEIVLLSVVEPVPAYLTIDIPQDILEGAVADSKARLEDLKARSGIAATVEVRIGPPAHEILAAANEHKADLIVIASHVPDFSNYLLGATADRVVRHAECSVLVDR